MMFRRRTELRVLEAAAMEGLYRTSLGVIRLWQPHHRHPRSRRIDRVAHQLLEAGLLCYPPEGGSFLDITNIGWDRVVVLRYGPAPLAGV